MDQKALFTAEWGQNSGYVAELYELYRMDPALVGESWAKYFGNLNGSAAPTESTSSKVSTNGYAAKLNGHAVPEISTALLSAQAKVTNLIESFRARGHLRAKVNPLTSASIPLPNAADLDLEWYGFSAAELQQRFAVNGFAGHKDLTPTELFDLGREIYCGPVGIEYTHIHSAEEREWLRVRIEERERFPENLAHTPEIRKRILERLIWAEEFESELHQKYVGQKRFSLQGGDTLIPLVDLLLSHAARAGVWEAIIGMAHRGRLNMLVNILGKQFTDLFSEFEDQSIFSSLGSGDVKYHLGYEAILKGAFGGQIKTSLAPNPSHLEFVNPVVAGIARGKQDAFYNRERGATLPIVIHGDSAMIGQGVVTETLQLARVDGYTCGGTIHIVVNNQIGFTLDPKDSRSSPYSTEWCKAIEAPIFHVNAEDPDAAAWAILLSAEFRQQFKRDAVVDLYCYRKYGHNEADDPSFTQPVIYSEIRQKKNISVGYAERLIADNSISQAEVDQMRAGFSKRFDDAYATRKPPTYGDGCSLIGKLSATPKTTGIENEALKQIVHTLVQYPEGFTPHPKLAKILEKRVELVEQGEGLDWAICEALSFGSLVLEGFAVRLSGQDCGRGTFSQRHLALRDYNTGTAFYPLQLLSQAAPGSPTFEVYNSVLSETGVMGFEFGYSSVHKGALVLWEAQFGDFANGAQVIIDQFISSSEAKWNQLSGLVLLLPHGYEGQGPEHSSARLERYLQLAADGNMSVCYPSNGAQYFHLLRRQALNPLRRPLIVMTPKSLLRNPEATVSVGDLEKGVFKPVIEEKLSETTKAKRIVFVTGKIFYDVRAAIREKKVGDVSIVRIEELYPFAKDELKAILKRHGAKKLAWVQEEPQNMGAWSFIDPLFRSELGVDLTYFGRPPSASTATGSGKRHAKEQKLFLDNLVDFLQK